MKENKRTVHAEGGRVVRHSIPSNILFWLKIYWKWEPGVVLLAALELILGALVPLWTYRAVSKRTIVERLREAEG